MMFKSATMKEDFFKEMWRGRVPYRLEKPRINSFKWHPLELREKTETPYGNKKAPRKNLADLPYSPAASCPL